MSNSRLYKQKFITSSNGVTTSGSFTIPLSVDFIFVTGCGGGGAGGQGGGGSTTGGGSSNTFATGGGGGGAAITTTFIKNVTPGVSISYTIGAGGISTNSGGSANINGSAGGSGVDSTITIGGFTYIFEGAEGGWGGFSNGTTNYFTAGGYPSKYMELGTPIVYIIPAAISTLGLYQSSGRGGFGGATGSSGLLTNAPGFSSPGSSIGIGGGGGGAGGSGPNSGGDWAGGGGGGGAVSNNALSTGGAGGKGGGGDGIGGGSVAGIAGTFGGGGGGAGGGYVNASPGTSAAGGKGGDGLIEISWIV